MQIFLFYFCIIPLKSDHLKSLKDRIINSKISKKNMTKNGFCRTKKVDQLTDKQTKYLIKLREEELNKGYKGFENGLFIQKKRISFFHFKLSKWSDLKWDNRKKVKKKFAK